MNVMIVAGGERPSFAFLLKKIDEFSPDRIIAADGGANVLREYGIVPHIILGDMDSVKKGLLDFYRSKCELITYPAQKDETDLELALLKAKELGAVRVLLLGATGGRVDHTLANLFLLRRARELGMAAAIEDEDCGIYLVRRKKEFRGCKGHTLSVFPFSEKVEGIKSVGLYYPIPPLRFGDIIGISNVITEDEASLSLESGEVLLILHRKRAE